MSLLRLHTDDELRQRLGLRVVAREPLHEWPLSCVQRLRLEDGASLVYKSQLPPTVEPEFYARASSPLLPPHRALDRLGDCRTMTLAWIGAPLLRDAARGEAGLVEHGRQVVARIGEIRGDLPRYLDVGSHEAWRAAAETAVAKLDALVASRRFARLRPAAVARVGAWTESPRTLDAILDHPTLTHGDLRADQVFVAADGYRVIDWQRPVVAPRDTDLVSLLVGEGIDPRKHLDPAIVRVFWFLRLHWAVTAQVDLFPQFQGDLFERWGVQAMRHILA